MVSLTCLRSSTICDVDQLIYDVWGLYQQEKICNTKWLWGLINSNNCIFHTKEKDLTHISKPLLSFIRNLDNQTKVCLQNYLACWVNMVKIGYTQNGFNFIMFISCIFYQVSTSALHTWNVTSILQHTDTNYNKYDHIYFSYIMNKGITSVISHLTYWKAHVNGGSKHGKECFILMSLKK